MLQVSGFRVFNYTTTDFSKNDTNPLYPGGIEFTLEFRPKPNNGCVKTEVLTPHFFTDPLLPFASVGVSDFNSFPWYVNHRCHTASNSEIDLEPCSGVALNGFPLAPTDVRVWLSADASTQK